MIVPFSLPRSAVQLHKELSLKPPTERELILILIENRKVIDRKHRYRKCWVKMVRLYRLIGNYSPIKFGPTTL